MVRAGFGNSSRLLFHLVKLIDPEGDFNPQPGRDQRRFGALTVCGNCDCQPRVRTPTCKLDISSMPRARSDIYVVCMGEERSRSQDAVASFSRRSRSRHEVKLSRVGSIAILRSEALSATSSERLLASSFTYLRST